MTDNQKPKKYKGLAAMSPEQRKEICTLGGKARAALQEGNTLQAIGRKGGNLLKEKVGLDYYKEMGKMGGRRSAEARAEKRKALLERVKHDC